MIEIKEKSSCCGCNACVQACPVNCITMKTDEEGFWYPEVDSDNCLSCNKCNHVCPIENKTEYSEEIIASYAARTKNEDVLLNSSSGGLFFEIAKNIIHKGGIVFGAAFDEDYSVRHISVDSLDDLVLLQGSKYLQSNIGNSYIEAKKYLCDGKEVLYTGTACQIAGLKRYLGKDYDNLLTIDVLCHGVPSPLVWKKYLNELNNNETLGLVEKVSFRSKEYGWNDFSLEVDFKNKNKYIKKFMNDPYMRLFLANICLRPSCHDCC